MLHRHATLLCSALLATDALAEPHGLVEDSQLELRNRNFYFNRDFRNGASNGQGDNAARPANQRNGYPEEWVPIGALRPPGDSMRTRVANYRGNREAQVDLQDINEVRLIIEYPLTR